MPRSEKRKKDTELRGEIARGLASICRKMRISSSDLTATQIRNDCKSFDTYGSSGVRKDMDTIQVYLSVLMHELESFRRERGLSENVRQDAIANGEDYSFIAASINRLAGLMGLEREGEGGIVLHARNHIEGGLTGGYVLSHVAEDFGTLILHGGALRVYSNSRRDAERVRVLEERVKDLSSELTEARLDTARANLLLDGAQMDSSELDALMEEGGMDVDVVLEVKDSGYRAGRPNYGL